MPSHCGSPLGKRPNQVLPLFAAALSLSILLSAAAPCQTRPRGPRLIVCSEDQPTGCDKPSFQKAFKDAAFVALETHPADRMATGQLTQMLTSLGKSVSPPDTTPGLTLSLQRLNTEGVFIGPAGAPLATLLVYGPAQSGTHGTLLWSETLTAQPDISWPATVHALLTQFQAQAITR